MLRTFVVLSGILLVAAPHALAQDSVAALLPGQRIRVDREGAKPVVGAFLFADSARLGIRAGRIDTLIVPRTGITSLERSLGRKSLVGKGALFGAGFGLVGGVIVSAIACEEGGMIGQGGCIAGVGLVSAVLGAAAGAIVGAFIHTDRWQSVSWPVLTVAPGTPNAPGVSLGLRIKF